MNFRRGRHHEEPEINLIPLIDVLLVILIFLMVTTTYSKFSGLEINLPTADAPPPEQQEPNEINVVVTATGDVMINREPLGARDVAAISLGLKKASGTRKEPVVVPLGAVGYRSKEENVWMTSRMTCGHPFSMCYRDRRLPLNLLAGLATTYSPAS